MKIIIALCIVALAATSSQALAANRQSTDINFCQECRSTISYISKFNTSANDELFSDALKSLCNIHFPSSMDYRDGPCGIIISATQYLIRHTDPVHHCDQIGACANPKSISSSSLISTQDTGVFCDVCKSGFESIKAKLQDKEMLAKLQSILESFCEYLKVIDESEDCKVHIPEIISYITNLANQIDPQTYCESVQVCQHNEVTIRQIFGDFGLFLSGHLGPESPVFLMPATTTTTSTPLALAEERGLESDKFHKKGPTCLLCKFIVKELNHMLKDNRTEANIENKLELLCDKVFSADSKKRAKCENFVEKYSKRLVEILAEEMNPELVCILLEQCVYSKFEEIEGSQFSNNNAVLKDEQDLGNNNDNNNDKFSLAKTGTIQDLFLSLDSTLTAGSFEVCVECKLFIKYLQSIMKNPKSEQEMIDALKKDLCAKLGQNERKQCDSLIDKYAVDFFKAVSQSISPTETCEKLGACKPKKNDPLAQISEFINSFIKQASEIEQTEFVELPPQNEVEKKVETTICEDCIKIIQSIDDYLSKEDIDNNVDKLVENVCNKMQDNLKSKCTYVIELVGSQIIQIVSNMQNPTQVCKDFYMC